MPNFSKYSLNKLSKNNFIVIGRLKNQTTDTRIVLLPSGYRLFHKKKTKTETKNIKTVLDYLGRNSLDL